MNEVVYFGGWDHLPVGSVLEDPLCHSGSSLAVFRQTHTATGSRRNVLCSHNTLNLITGLIRFLNLHNKLNDHHRPKQAVFVYHTKLINSHEQTNLKFGALCKQSTPVFNVYGVNVAPVYLVL